MAVDSLQVEDILVLPLHVGGAVATTSDAHKVAVKWGWIIVSGLGYPLVVNEDCIDYLRHHFRMRCDRK
jgi:hypothetical protein